MRLAFLAALAAGTSSVLVGCADQDSLPPFEFESSRARIGVTQDEFAPCAHDLDRIDAQVEFVEDRMGLDPRSRIDVFIMEVAELPCDGAWGCYTSRDRVFSPWFAIEHELSHAVMKDIEFPSTFWLEGNAELLAGTRGSRQDPNIVLTPELFDADDLPNYLEATHFQRYLVESRGWEAYGQLVRGGFDIEAVYGVTPGELAAEYEAEAPAGYPPLDTCNGPAIEATGDGLWELEVVFSCADASQLEGHSYSNDVGAATHRTVALEAGTYEVRQDGGTVLSIEGCWTEILDTIPTTIPSNGDIPNEVDRGRAFPFVANETHRITVTDGLYRFSLGSGTESEATLGLTVRRVD